MSICKHRSYHYKTLTLFEINKLSMKKITLFSVLISMILIYSCKTDTNKSTEETQTPEMVKKYVLSPFTPSPEFTDAKIQNVSYNDGKFKFTIDSESYELGQQTPDAPQKMCANSAKGQHIHLILNDAPYAAKYTADFDYKIEDGNHHMLAFLSRSYHESIKTPSAHTAQLIEVKDSSIVDATAITDPMVFYSRPKGTYVGDDTKKVMLDFYLVNTSISEGGNYVEANINGEIHNLNSWRPYYVENLPDGENSITLSLKDRDGNLIKTAHNPVTRKFMLQKDPVAQDK